MTNTVSQEIGMNFAVIVGALVVIAIILLLIRHIKKINYDMKHMKIYGADLTRAETNLNSIVTAVYESDNPAFKKFVDKYYDTFENLLLTAFDVNSLMKQLELIIVKQVDDEMLRYSTFADLETEYSFIKPNEIGFIKIGIAVQPFSKNIMFFGELMMETIKEERPELSSDLVSYTGAAWNYVIQSMVKRIAASVPKNGDDVEGYVRSVIDNYKGTPEYKEKRVRTFYALIAMGLLEDDSKNMAELYDVYIGLYSQVEHKKEFDQFKEDIMK